MSALVFVLALAAVQPAVILERVAEVRVHGNYATPDADVLALAGDLIGRPATDALVAEVTRRLTGSDRFSAVDVRKRYLSIADPTRILLMIVVDERPGATSDVPIPTFWTRATAGGMWLPTLRFEDGYGFTYGARIGFADVLGRGSQVSVPLTWGGERRAAVEAERSFMRGQVARVLGSAGVRRRINPYYGVSDRRTAVQARAELSPAAWLRTGTGVRVDQVKFGAVDDRVVAVGVDGALDTRVDPAFPRNAVFASFGWERLAFGQQRSARRVTTDLRGYIGLVNRAVLVVRGFSTIATAPLPPFEQALLGGASSVRGYRVGARAGDNLGLLSAELRVPITSPLSLGRFGVQAFVDAGTAYPHGAALADQRFERGYGGGIFLTAAVLSAGLDVARSRTGNTRAHFSLGLRLGR